MNCLKFSAVLVGHPYLRQQSHLCVLRTLVYNEDDTTHFGVISEKSSILIRPAGVLPTLISKKTTGRPFVPAPGVAILDVTRSFTGVTLTGGGRDEDGSYEIRRLLEVRMSQHSLDEDFGRRRSQFMTRGHADTASDGDRGCN